MLKFKMVRYRSGDLLKTRPFNICSFETCEVSGGASFQARACPDCLAKKSQAMCRWIFHATSPRRRIRENATQSLSPSERSFPHDLFPHSRRRFRQNAGLVPIPRRPFPHSRESGDVEKSGQARSIPMRYLLALSQLFLFNVHFSPAACCLCRKTRMSVTGST